MFVQVHARLGCDLECLVRRALGRDLEDPRSVLVEPQLGDDPPPELLGLEDAFQDERRTEGDESVHVETSGSMVGEEGTLLLGEDLADRACPLDHLADIGPVVTPLREPEHTPIPRAARRLRP
jgi:hypothetical protein